MFYVQLSLRSTCCSLLLCHISHPGPWVGPRRLTDYDLTGVEMLLETSLATCVSWIWEGCASILIALRCAIKAIKLWTTAHWMGMDMDMAGFSSSNARHQFRMPPMFLHPSASLLKSPQVQELKKKKKKNVEWIQGKNNWEWNFALHAYSYMGDFMP